MYFPSLQALATDSVSDNILILYKPLSQLDQFIGSTHDVGYRLIEGMKKTRTKIVSGGNEKQDKLINIFIHKIYHGLNITLYISPYSTLVKSNYLYQFLEIHGSKVHGIVMTDSQSQYNIITDCVADVMCMLHMYSTIDILQKIINVVKVNTLSLQKLRLCQPPNVSSAPLRYLEPLYKSHLSHSLSILHLCHISFALDMREIRRCMRDMINLTELRLVNAEFVYDRDRYDRYRHPFTLPVHIPQRQPQDQVRRTVRGIIICGCCLWIRGDYHDHDHEGNHDRDPDRDFVHTKLEVLVVSRHVPSPYQKYVCNNPKCPQIREMDNLFTYYPNLRVMDFTNVSLHDNSIHKIISNVKKTKCKNNKKFEKVVLSPFNEAQEYMMESERLDVLEIHRPQKYHTRNNDPDLDLDPNPDYDCLFEEMYEIIKKSNCVTCVDDNDIIWKMADYFVKVNHKNQTETQTQTQIQTYTHTETETEETIQKTNAALMILMEYVIRNTAALFTVTDQVLESMIRILRGFVSLVPILPCLNYMGRWLSHITILMDYYYAYNLMDCEDKQTLQNKMKVIYDITGFRNALI